MEERKLVSQAKYAELNGVSRQYVNKLVKEGQLVLVDGLIDVSAANAELEKKCQASESDDPGSNSYWVEKTRHEKAKASLAEIELQIKRGEILVIADVVQEVEKMFVAMRQKLLAAPSKLAPLLVAVSLQEAQEIVEK